MILPVHSKSLGYAPSLYPHTKGCQPQYFFLFTRLGNITPTPAYHKECSFLVYLL
jgi:hypothetical protein